MSESTTTQPADAPEAPQPGAQQSAAAWFDALPEDMRGDTLIRKYPDLPAFVNGFRNAQKLIGAEKIPLPRSEDPEVWSQVWNRLGRPEQPDGYKLERPADVKVPVAGEMEADFRKHAHSLGLTSKQAQGLYGWYLQSAQQSAAQLDQTLEADKAAGEQALRQEWGRAYDQELARAKAAMRTVFDQGDIEALEARGLGNDPAFIKMLAKVGKAMGEDSVDGAPVTGMLSPADAQRRINEIMGDPQHPYRNPRHPAHQQAVQDMAGLFEQAYPAG